MVGIPNWLIYLTFGDYMAGQFENTFRSFSAGVIIQKITPLGVEALTLSIVGVIMSLGTRVIRELLGAYINDHFVHVTKENL